MGYLQSDYTPPKPREKGYEPAGGYSSRANTRISHHEPDAMGNFWLLILFYNMLIYACIFTFSFLKKNFKGTHRTLWEKNRDNKIHLPLQLQK